jgi:cytochrome c biogenesis protein CcdA/glutaredoxin
MKKLILLGLMFLPLLITVVNAQEEICIYYFYGVGCPHCANVKPVLDNLEEKYQNIHIHRLEIYHNKTNQDLFNSYCSEYDISRRGVPFVAIDEKYFMGDTPIIENLEEEIIRLSDEGAECPIPEDCQGIIDGNKTNISPPEKKITIPLIITAGLTDGVNPCAFSVLIFLVTYLLSIGSRKRIVIIGLSYILAVYIAYFAAGMGLLTVIQLSGLTQIIYKLAAFVALVVGLFNLKDFFWYGKWFSFKIPEVSKGTIEKYTKMATLPSALILGFLVSAFELPCTGGVYLAILGMLAGQSTKLAAVPYLLLYNLMFVLPLILILLIVYFGIPPEKAEQWRKSKRKWMKLISGLLMIGLGIWMLFK